MKRAVAVCLMGLFPAIASAADLLDVYRDALANDALFAAARAELQAGQEQVIQGRAGLLPNVGVSAGISRERLDPAGTPSSSYNSDSWSVQLTQPLFRMQNWIQAQQGELQTNLAEVEFALARQDLILRVSEAYFNVLNAQDSLEALRQLRAAAAEQFEIADTSFEVGTVTITDVHEAQSRLDLAEAQVIAAESELAVRRDALAQIIGTEPQPLARLRPEIELGAPIPADQAEWVAAAQSGGFGVQLQSIIREISAREVERSRAGHYPTVDLVASHGRATRQSAPGAGPRTEVTSIGVQLNLPLYAGGATSSVTREAAALRVRADADLEGARREAVQLARQFYLGVTSGVARVNALEAAEVSSLSALEASQLGYEVGIRINIDVLNAQSQLAETRQALAQARYDTLLAQLRLKAASGSLGPEDLQLINALLIE